MNIVEMTKKAWEHFWNLHDDPAGNLSDEYIRDWFLRNGYFTEEIFKPIKN